MTWGSYQAWSSDNLDLQPVLCCPMRILWQDYINYCKEWGFTRSPAADFVRWILGEEGVTVKKGGSGRIRRMVMGAGLQQKGNSYGRN